MNVPITAVITAITAVFQRQPLLCYSLVDISCIVRIKLEVCTEVEVSVWIGRTAIQTFALVLVDNCQPGPLESFEDVDDDAVELRRMR